MIARLLSHLTLTVTLQAKGLLLNAVNSIEQSAPLAASLVIQLIELNSISDMTTIISSHSAGPL